MKAENEKFWLGDVMPIGGYYGPIASYRDEEFGYVSEDFLQNKYFQMIADCGLNIIVSADSDYAKNSQEVENTLELCEKYNLRFFVKDSGITNDMTADEVKKRIDFYRSAKAFSGICVIDEPSACGFPKRFNGEQLLVDSPVHKYGRLATHVNEDEHLIGYVNLLPFYYWMGNTVEEYYNYVEECCKECQLKVLSYDHYPFDFAERENALETYFMNLGIIRDAAVQRNIPFWAFIQCGGQWNDRKNHFESRPYYPTEGEFLWNVNTCLAMGARGIQYFPLVQPHWFGFAIDGDDSRRNGLIGSDGVANAWYTYAKKANRQIVAVDEILMNATHRGVLAYEKTRTYVERVGCVLQEKDISEITNVKTEAAGVFIGCFDYNGQTAFYVVNGDMENQQEVELQFSGNCNMRLVSSLEMEHITTNQITLIQKPGDATLVLIEK